MSVSTTEEKKCRQKQPPEVSTQKVFSGLKHATLLKRDSGTGVFLWILQNFYKHFFHRTPLDDCFCAVPFKKWKVKGLSTNLYININFS